MFVGFFVQCCDVFDHPLKRFNKQTLLISRIQLEIIVIFLSFLLHTWISARRKKKKIKSLRIEVTISRKHQSLSMYSYKLPLAIKNRRIKNIRKHFKKKQQAESKKNTFYGVMFDQVAVPIFFFLYFQFVFSFSYLPIYRIDGRLLIVAKVL